MNLRTITLLIINILFLACSQDSKEFHFKSQDELTGGFSDYQLDLYSDNKLKLKIEFSKEDEYTDGGAIRSSIKEELTGAWHLKNNTINYKFDQRKSFIDSIVNEIRFNKKDSILRFSNKLDTAYIFGIPCVKLIH